MRATGDSSDGGGGRWHVRQTGRRNVIATGDSIDGGGAMAGPANGKTVRDSDRRFK